MNKNKIMKRNNKNKKKFKKVKEIRFNFLKKR
jgi:hypothetical protein